MCVWKEEREVFLSLIEKQTILKHYEKLLQHFPNQTTLSFVQILQNSRISCKMCSVLQHSLLFFF